MEYTGEEKLSVLLAVHASRGTILFSQKRLGMEIATLLVSNINRGPANTCCIFTHNCKSFKHFSCSLVFVCAQSPGLLKTQKAATLCTADGQIAAASCFQVVGVLTQTVVKATARLPNIVTFAQWWDLIHYFTSA